MIPVLHKAQELFGYLPREVQEYVAAGLGVPVTEVYGVVTFYSLFTMQPKGRHTISLCMGTACYVKGAQAILDALREQLGVGPGETTEDARFTFEVMRCMGACGLAPVLVVDEDIYGKVTPEGLAEILKNTVNEEAQAASVEAAPGKIDWKISVCLLTR